MDLAKVEADYEYVRRYLEGLDIVEMRKTRLLSLTGAIVANLIMVALLFIVWLWWRGYV